MGFEEAKDGVKLLATKEGLGLGISSGAALMGAIRLAMRKENADKNIVTLFPDGIEKYLTY